MAQMLTRRDWPAYRSPDAFGTEDRVLTRTEQLRQLLRQRGPMTAQQLAEAVDLPRNTLVGALLKGDLHRGSVMFEGGRYEWQHGFDAELETELGRAAALLRRHGWAVSRCSQ